MQRAVRSVAAGVSGVEGKRLTAGWSLAEHMRQSRANFKFAFRQCKADEAQYRAEALSAKMQDGRIKSFWHDIRSAKSNPQLLVQRVDQATGERDVAELWMRKYRQVFNSIDDARSQDDFTAGLRDAVNEPINFVTVEELKAIVCALPNNKAVGLDTIPNELFKQAPQWLLVWLSQTFNTFLAHCFLPLSFTDVYLVPLLKNKLKDHADSANYRPIAIATAASKVFERLLSNRLIDFLDTTDNQFGFKPHHSTEMCVFTLKEVVRYYLQLNTPIFLCFIDVKSAFDRVSYWLLLSKLQERGVPLYLLLILQHWFTEQQLCVRWGATISDTFNMKNGIRQGSVLSPILFNVYVDQLNVLLNDSRIGCHIANKAVNNFAYADDLAIVCPSASALNDLLRICEDFARHHYIQFSTNKSVCMNICPSSCHLSSRPDIYFCGTVLEYVEKFTYLGHVIIEDFNDDEDVKKETRNLCARGNALIRTFYFANFDVKIRLFTTYCFSFYCSPLWNNFRVATLSRLRVTYNNIMRRLAGVPPWHSAREMFVHSGVDSFAERVRWQCWGTMQRVTNSQNVLVQTARDSDAGLHSQLWQRWIHLLYLHPPP